MSCFGPIQLCFWFIIHLAKITGHNHHWTIQPVASEQMPSRSEVLITFQLPLSFKRADSARQQQPTLRCRSGGAVFEQVTRQSKVRSGTAGKQLHLVITKEDPSPSNPRPHFLLLHQERQQGFPGRLPEVSFS